MSSFFFALISAPVAQLHFSRPQNFAAIFDGFDSVRVKMTALFEPSNQI
jgi:hypothetical protein